MEAVNEARRNRGSEPIYSEAEVINTRLGTDPVLYPNVDWMNEVFDDFGHNRRATLT